MSLNKNLYECWHKKARQKFHKNVPYQILSVGLLILINGKRLKTPSKD